MPVLADVVMTLPSGQTRFVFPGMPRAPYLTGQQEPCTDCAAAGLFGLGVSRDGPGSAALCLGCWRARQRRAPRRGSLSPEEAGQLAEIEEQLACLTCRPDSVPPEVDLPPEAVQARRHQRRRERARGRDRSRRPAPKRSGCWRCGDSEWLASVRAVHDADQAQAAVEAERVDELHAVLRAARRRAGRAQRRLAAVQDWQDRVSGVVAAGPLLVKTGSRGKLQLKRGPGRQARAVWLIADFLARMHAERAARGVSGGRPPQHPLVVGVMAIAADPAAGRGSMAGLAPTAVYAGVTTRTVSSTWAYSVLVGATVEVERGRTCSLAELDETGLRRRRSVYDFTALHTSPFEPEPFLGAAAAVVAALLERAVQLVDERQGVLEEAERAVAAAEAALLDAQAVVAERVSEDLLLQASVDRVWAADAKAAYAAAVVARGRANLAMAAPPVDVRAVAAADRTGRTDRAGVVATVVAAFDAVSRMESFFHPPRSGSSKRSSSGSRGLIQNPGFLTFRTSTSLVAGGQRPDGRGEQHKGGASRPAPTKGVAEQTSSLRPRTPDSVSTGSPARPRRSEVMLWAKPLAEGLARRWEFLQRFLDDADNGRRSPREVAREYGLRVAMIASTLGSRLNRRWTPADVVRLVEHYGLAGRYAAVRTVIGAGDAHSPLVYLARVLDRALTNPAATVPHYSPVREAFEQEVLAAELATQAERTADLRAQLDKRTATAAATTGSGLAAFRAARAALGHHPGGPAQAPAELTTGTASENTATDWPEPAQPGASLPASRLAGKNQR